MPLRERQEVEEVSWPASVTAAELKSAAEQLCLCLRWVKILRRQFQATTSANSNFRSDSRHSRFDSNPVMPEQKRSGLWRMSGGCNEGYPTW